MFKHSAGAGEPMYMYPGNLLIQPNFALHDHTNNSNEQIIRIDALDSGLVKLFVDISVDSFLNTLSS